MNIVCANIAFCVITCKYDISMFTVCAEGLQNVVKCLGDH